MKILLDPNTCLDSQFTCSNRNCVSRSVECDGMNDCGDFSDEITPCSGSKLMTDILIY